MTAPPSLRTRIQLPNKEKWALTEIERLPADPRGAYTEINRLFLVSATPPFTRDAITQCGSLHQFSTRLRSARTRSHERVGNVS